MITLRPAAERGSFDHGWLKTAHTFSFGEYFHPDHMDFRALRVINEDHIAPGKGFGSHPHRDMEILTYVISGALEHKDDMGNGSVLRRGDVQRMSAGTGVVHSEFNPSQEEECHLLQIWLMPESKGLEPGYQQIAVDLDEQTNRLVPFATPTGRDGAVRWNQDAWLFGARLETGRRCEAQLAPGRHGWVQVVSGALQLNDVSGGPGDGLAISNHKLLDFSATQDAEFLFFDLP